MGSTPGIGGTNTASNGSGSSGSTDGSGGGSTDTGNTGGTDTGGGGGGTGGGGNGHPVIDTANHSTLLGDGSVLISAGNQALRTPAILPTAVTDTLASVATPLVSAGNALLTPVADATAPVTGNLPVDLNLLNTQVGGTNTTPLLGVGLLSTDAANGTLAAVNVASGGDTAALSLLPDGVSDVSDGVTSTLSGVTSALPVTLAVGDNTVGSPTQPIAVGLLSPEAAVGSLASINVDGGGTTGVTLNPDTLGIVASTLSPVLDVASALPLNSNVLGTVLSGTSASPAGLALLSPVAADNSMMATNVASGGVTGVTANQAGSAVANTVASLTGAGGGVVSAVTGAVTGAASGVTGGAVSTVSSTVNSVAGTVAAVNVANAPLISGSNPLVGVSALSGNQNSGSLVTAGVASAGQPLTVKVGNTTLLGSGSLLSGLSLLGH